MKHLKILLIGSVFIFSGNLLFSQSETSAIRLAGDNSYNIGSARYQAMSGSMGAIGVEYAALNTNPAGLCMYRSSGKKVSLTLGFDTSFDKNRWYGGYHDHTEYKFRFDEFSWISSLKSNNFGFSFGLGVQRGASFDRDVSIWGGINGKGSSIADYAAAVVNRYKGKDAAISQKDFEDTGAFERYPWLATLAARNIWIASDANKGLLYFSNFRQNPPGSGISASNFSEFNLKERGNTMKYNVTFGFDLTSRFYMGIIMNFYSLNYDLSYLLKEEHRPDENRRSENLSLSNTLSIRGGGADFGVGMIVEPVDGLRFGLAAFSPTYYSLKESFYAKATSNVAGEFGNVMSTPNDGYNAYEMSTPWRFTFSTAYIWGQHLALNFDYEASILNSTMLMGQGSDSDYYKVDNMAIKDDFTVRNTFRLGAEFNVTNRLALRAGASYTSSGIKSDLIGSDGIPNRELLVSGTQTHYAINKDSKNVAIGIGYKITPRFSIDFSVSDRITENLLYAFPVISDPSPVWEKPDSKELFLAGYEPINMQSHLLHGALTFSYKF